MKNFKLLFCCTALFFSLLSAAPALARPYDDCMADAQLAGMPEGSVIAECAKAEALYNDCMADTLLLEWNTPKALPICVGAGPSYNDCMADESLAGVDKGQAILTCTGN